MTILGTALAPFLGWFLGLVGREAEAEIQRKKAKKVKRRRLEAARLKVAEDEYARQEQAAQAERARVVKSQRVLDDLAAQLKKLQVPSKENEEYGGVPYAENEVYVRYPDGTLKREVRR